MGERLDPETLGGVMAAFYERMAERFIALSEDLTATTTSRRRSCGVGEGREAVKFADETDDLNMRADGPDGSLEGRQGGRPGPRGP
jgi:hypothetical protein